MLASPAHRNTQARCGSGNVPLRWRPMQPRDVCECVQIVANHSVLAGRYGDAIKYLGPAWTRLFDYQAKNATVCEAQVGTNPVICALGISLYVTDDFVRELKTPPLFWIGPELARRLARGESPAISDKELREFNSSGGLNLVTWEGCFRQDFENNAEAHRGMINTFIEMHRGFLWKELIAVQMENADRLDWIAKTGGLLWNPAAAEYADPPVLGREELVRTPHVVGITRDIEMSRNKNWSGRGSWIGVLFEYEPPRLGFSRSEQELLMAALAGDSTDPALAATLDVSIPTIKKMWASIYRRVADVLPGIIPDSARVGAGVAERGHEKRRHLLAYVREHPEELRPYLHKPNKKFANRGLPQSSHRRLPDAG